MTDSTATADALTRTLLRFGIVIVGITIPYAARLLGGMEWLRDYTDNGVPGFLFLSAFNAIAWVTMLLVSLIYNRPVAMLMPCIFGFGFLGWAHYSLDLAADAQAAIALVFIPFVAIPFILVGAAIGYFVDRRSPHPNS